MQRSHTALIGLAILFVALISTFGPVSHAQASEGETGVSANIWVYYLYYYQNGNPVYYQQYFVDVYEDGETNWGGFDVAEYNLNQAGYATAETHQFWRHTNNADPR